MRAREQAMGLRVDILDLQLPHYVLAYGERPTDCLDSSV